MKPSRGMNLMNKYIVFLKTGLAIPIFSKKPLSTIDDLFDGESFQFVVDTVAGMIDCHVQEANESKWNMEHSASTSRIVVPQLPGARQ